MMRQQIAGFVRAHDSLTLLEAVLKDSSLENQIYLFSSDILSRQGR